MAKAFRSKLNILEQQTLKQKKDVCNVCKQQRCEELCIDDVSLYRLLLLDFVLNRKSCKSKQNDVLQ